MSAWKGKLYKHMYKNCLLGPSSRFTNWKIVNFYRIFLLLCVHKLHALIFKSLSSQYSSASASHFLHSCYRDARDPQMSPVGQFSLAARSQTEIALGSSQVWTCETVMTMKRRVCEQSAALRVTPTTNCDSNCLLKIAVYGRSIFMLNIKHFDLDLAIIMQQLKIFNLNFSLFFYKACQKNTNI